METVTVCGKEVTIPDAPTPSESVTVCDQEVTLPKVEEDSTNV